MRLAIPLAILAAGLAAAFEPAITETDGLRVEIPGLPLITAVEVPFEVPVKLANRAGGTRAGQLRLGVLEPWRIDGDAGQPFSLAPGAEAELVFRVVAGRGTYRAHYPVHAWAEVRGPGAPLTVHAVLVAEARPATEARAAQRSITALRAPAMRIDGDLREWADAAALDLGAGAAALGTAEPTDFSARALWLWDDDALYLGIQATDDRLAASDLASRDFVDSDYVRLTVGRVAAAERTATTLGGEDLILVVAPGAEPPAVKAVQYEGAGRADVDPAAVTVAAQREPTGWRLELRLPWSVVGAKPAAGETWLGNLQLGDADGGGRETELCLGGTTGEYWKDPRQAAPLRFSPATRDPHGASLPLTEVPARGVLQMARLRPGRVVVELFAGQSIALPYGQDQEPTTRANFGPVGGFARGESRESIGLHPPWSEGRLGAIAGEWRLALPATRPLRFRTGLAIRDVTGDEPPSDGVTFRVQVAPEGGEFTTLAERHTTATQWDELTADLSLYAGQVVTLRLVGDPGPDRDTTCDQGYFGGPAIVAGVERPAESAADRAARAEQAVEKARGLLEGRVVSGAWRVEGEAGPAAYAVVPGPVGLADAAIAMATPGGSQVYDGFRVDIDGTPLADLLAGDEAVTVAATERRPDAPLEARYQFAGPTGPATAVARIEPTAQGLRIAFAMPGVERNPRGQPWFTRLALGPSNEPARRCYFGHGHVVEGAPRFSMGYGGFSLSTSYAGAEYPGGLALVQATTPVPDRFDHDAGRRHTSLVASGDVTFDFIASGRGAFAGARAWRLLADLKPAPDVARIAGKMCIDQWGGDYGETAAELRLASAYGIDEAVFVKHVWQRWGYDYRLPDIFPPWGDRADFDAMASAARLNGRLFALHDNYIDFYPDADGFTYDAIQFQANGEPVRAWLNEGREAQSYRWQPTAFWPFLERNLRLVEDSLDPSAYFIDVFSAIAPHDYYDREGRFHSKIECIDWWGRTFDRTREVIDGPTISEAGTDALIGHLAAAQADHLEILRGGGGFPSLGLDYEAWDRVPWYDMAHHGRFVLFAGGLGGRYQNDRPTDLHGYGSDDYLSLTVLGGRTPMCDGPFYRRTVMTYYLLQPICAELERQEMLTHSFPAGDVRRQAVTWSDGAVTVNRSDADWTVDGRVLPSYGFVAQAGPHRADVTRRDGVISALATSPGLLFADARPPDRYTPTSGRLATEAVGFEATGPRSFRLVLKVRVIEPVAPVYSLFVHGCGPLAMLPGAVANSDILFQAGCDWRPQLGATPGEHTVTVTGTLPEGLLPGDIVFKYGLFNPATGARLDLIGNGFEDQRYDGGTVTVVGAGAATRQTWTAPAARGGNDRENHQRVLVDFGPVRTNTAFRLAHAGADWRLTLLPGSRAATVILRLDQLGAPGRTVAGIDQLDTDGAVVAPATFEHQGDEVTFGTADAAFGYRIRLAP